MKGRSNRVTMAMQHHVLLYGLVIIAKAVVTFPKSRAGRQASPDVHPFPQDKLRQKEAPCSDERAFWSRVLGRILLTVFAGPAPKHQDRVTPSIVYSHCSDETPGAPFSFMAWWGSKRLSSVPFMRLCRSPRAGPGATSVSLRDSRAHYRVLRR